MKDTQDAVKKIRIFFKRQRRLPTFQELADVMGFASKNAAFKLAQKLIDEGWLEKDDTGKLIPRNLFAPLPNTGIVKAGFPTVAEEDMQDIISFDQYLVNRPEATFILTVSGDSMIDAGIHEGDLVLVDRMQKVQVGDIVVAQVDREVTLKYYRKNGDQIVLMPANKNYAPIHPEESLEIAGVVVGVIRKYH
ncbi:repressor LexA [Candidatus Woesebacteria bacterium]|jgi:repressor LexA|nr:repressor LexA [Candidatus Woesebacteria bacterium]